MKRREFLISGATASAASLFGSTFKALARMNAANPPECDPAGSTVTVTCLGLVVVFAQGVTQSDGIKANCYQVPVSNCAFACVGNVSNTHTLFFRVRGSQDRAPVDLRPHTGHLYLGTSGNGVSAYQPPPDRGSFDRKSDNGKDEDFRWSVDLDVVYDKEGGSNGIGLKEPSGFSHILHCYDGILKTACKSPELLEMWDVPSMNVDIMGRDAVRISLTQQLTSDLTLFHRDPHTGKSSSLALFKPGLGKHYFVDLFQAAREDIERGPQTRAQAMKHLPMGSGCPGGDHSQLYYKAIGDPNILAEAHQRICSCYTKPGVVPDPRCTPSRHPHIDPHAICYPAVLSRTAVPT